MRRILKYTIGADAAGKSILQFLRKKDFSRNVITQLKKTENGITVNGIWEYASYILKENEVLSLTLEEPPDDGCMAASRELPPESSLPPLVAVYEDEDLLVINKPANMPIHPSIGNYGNTLADAVRVHAMQRQESYPYRCINRLDRDTSGLTVIAKNAYSSCILYKQMRERAIHRVYYAIAEGLMEEKGTVNAPIARKQASMIERIVDFESGGHAVTHYEALMHKNGLTFLKLRLETGRTHQIRVHMRHIGHPLIGDFLYNPSNSDMGRQALHAGELAFTHPASGQPLQFYAPLPEDMLQFFQMVIP